MQNKNQILEAEFRNYIKKTKHQDQVGFIPQMQGWFNIYKLVIHHIKKLKNSNHISINVEKILNKIQCAFKIKVLKILDTEEEGLSSTKEPEGPRTAIP